MSSCFKDFTWIKGCICNVILSILISQNHAHNKRNILKNILIFTPRNQELFKHFLKFSIWLSQIDYFQNKSDYFSSVNSEIHLGSQNWQDHIYFKQMWTLFIEVRSVHQLGKRTTYIEIMILLSNIITLKYI